MALRLFYQWMDLCGKSLPDVDWELDLAVAEYAEDLWQEGEPKHLLGDLLSALIFYFGFLRRSLHEGWKMLTVWSKLELPARAPPFSENILLAMVGIAYESGENTMAAAYFLGFHGLLRTGEILKLRVCDIKFSRDGRSAVIELGLTKGGLRRNQTEQIVIDNRRTLAALQVAAQGKRTGDLLFPPSTTFRKRFESHVRSLGLSSTPYKPYSLRRGGATFLFRSGVAVQRIQFMGRWQNATTAKIYIEDAVAMLSEIALTAKQRATVNRHAAFAASCFE